MPMPIPMPMLMENNNSPNSQQTRLFTLLSGNQHTNESMQNIFIRITAHTPAQKMVVFLRVESQSY